MELWKHVLSVAAILAVAGSSFAICARAADPDVSFDRQVLPILNTHCSACHTPSGVGFAAVNLDLRTYAGLMSGSAGGMAVIPYHPERSQIMRVLDDDWHSADQTALKMPPLGPQLSPDELKVISEWIRQGAKNN